MKIKENLETIAAAQQREKDRLQFIRDVCRWSTELIANAGHVEFVTTSAAQLRQTALELLEDGAQGE